MAFKIPGIGKKTEKTDEAVNPAASKKTKKSEQGEYLPETVGSAIIDTVLKNERFIVRENGKCYYIGMLLDANKIGGINKKAVNNKDIGGIIESIKDSHVDAYVTEEFNNNNEILFIPTTVTIDRLGDYGAFKRIDGYEFIKLDKNLNVHERTGVIGSYDDFRAILSGSVPITDFVKPKDVIVQGSPEDPTTNHNKVANVVNKVKDATSTIVEKAAPVVNKVAETVSEKIAESSGIKDMVTPKKTVKPEVQQTAQAEQSKQEVSTKPVQQASVQQAVMPVPASQPAAPAEDEMEVIHTETSIMSTIERTFHADNLELPISTEPFDQLFTLNNHLIKFDIDSRDNYVNERLNVMAADANRDLQKLRADNLRKLREKYVMTMAVRIQDIQREFDVKDVSNEYGSRKNAIEMTRDQRREAMASEIEAKRKQIEDEYEEQLNAYVEGEAKKARAEYNNKYQRTLNDRTNQVESLVKSEIENDYNRDIKQLYDERRSEAMTMLDLNITMALQELSEDYKKMFEAENALYNERAEKMREYVKELHAEDAKRLAVEEERNRISNEVNDARAEAAAKIELIKKEYDMAQNALEARSAATIAQAENETVLIKEQMEKRTATLESDKERLQHQLDEAIERADKAQETVRADFEHRLTQAQDDRDSWKQTLESYKEQHKHNNRLAAILVVAITIAAVAGGFVAGGVYWNRIVAGELSGNSGDVSINVIEPIKSEDESEAETSDEGDMSEETDVDTIDNEASDDGTFETDVSETSLTVTTVSDDDSVATSVTTVSTNVTEKAVTSVTTVRN